MKLIGTATSPFVRKVRVVLAEKKLDCPYVEDDVMAPDSLAARHNPLGKVPCLLLEGGEAVFDSRVIVEYLDALSPVGRLIPAAGRERMEVKQWEALADGLLDAAVLARQESHWPGRAEGERSPAWIARQLGKIEAALAQMERQLGDRPWCHGIHMSLADVALGCALGYLDFRFPQLDWRARHPRLLKLHDKLMARPSFADTRPPL